MARPSLQQQDRCRGKGFWISDRISDRCMCIKQSVHMARKPKQNLGEHRYGKVYLFPSAVICSCPVPPLPKSSSPVCFSPASRWFWRKWPALRAQRWLLIHFGEPSCHAWHLASAANAVTRRAFLRVCDSLLSRCSGCFRNRLTSSDCGDCRSMLMLPNFNPSLTVDNRGRHVKKV